MAIVKRQFVVIHIIGIILFLCLPVLLLLDNPAGKTIWAILTDQWFWIFSGIYIILFYGNAYWLFPNLYLKKERIAYIIVLLALLLFICFLQPFDHLINLNQPPRPFMPPGPVEFSPRQRHIDFVSIFLFIVIAALSTLIPVASQWQIIQQQYLIAQKDKATAELSFLKAQINPHFLFNTLNNLYSLSLTNSDKTSESILRLSNIMRYVTDEVNTDYVPLENEISCLNDFIELQKLRLNNKTTVQFDHEKANGTLLIAPLILLPFIENIFKHGISNNESSTIEISIASREKEILFRAKNKINTAQSSRSGTGINNVKKRLDNLYPGKHFLQIENDDRFFEVHLIINAWS